MIEKDIYSVDENDLQSLIDNEVGEKKAIEYKSQLKLEKRDEKKEFLADVSSFANTSGGDLILGISEDRDTGKPAELNGIELTNPDNTISTIENLIRDGIKPRIMGLTVNPISLKNGNTAIIIRVPNSWNSPHRVVLGHHDKFYARSSNGKYPMDIDELRNAFILSSTIDEKMNEFIEDRIYRVYSNKAPVPLDPGGKVIFHLVPISSFKLHKIYDIKSKELVIKSCLRPLSFHGYNYQYTLDGYMTLSDQNSYSLFFRNGIIEAVDGRTLNVPSGGKVNKIIPTTTLESVIIEAFNRFLPIYREMNIDTPVFIFVSLVGIQNFVLGVSTQVDFQAMYGRKVSYNGDTLRLISGKIDQLVLDESEIGHVFKPIFDSLWNAYGYPESSNFTPEGKWAARY